MTGHFCGREETWTDHVLWKPSTYGYIPKRTIQKGSKWTVLRAKTGRSLVELDGPKGFGPKHSRVSVQKTVRFSPLVPFTFGFLDRPVWHMTAHFRLDPYTRLTVSNVNFSNWSLKIFLAYWSHLSIYGCVKNWWTSCRFSQQIQSWWCSWWPRSKIGHFWMSMGVNQAAVFSPWAYCKEK